MALIEESGPEQDNPPKDNVLSYAWELYETYSGGSQKQKTANSGIRQQVIWLIFWTSVLAVLTSLPGVRQLLSYAAAWLDTRYGLGNNWVRSGNFVLSAVLIIMSVSTSALLAFAGQFTPLKAWIMYRAGADRIRSEIYLYRMGAGEYARFPEGSAERRGRFLERIEAINREIYELETAPPFLQLMGKDEGSYVLSRPRQLWRRIKRPIGRIKRKERVKAIQPFDAKAARDGKIRLSGRYFPDQDDGFNEIGIDTYIEYRVLPQRDWYVKKVYEDYEKIKDWRKVTLIIGGLSAVLAAIQLEPYIVITTAAAVAINTHIQLNLIGSTYGNYHVTASRMDSEVVRWRNLPEKERYSNEAISQFVTNIEGILESERAIWMQQASQAQQESEQTLIKGAGKRDGKPALLANSGLVTPNVTDVYEISSHSAYESGESMDIAEDSADKSAADQKPATTETTTTSTTGDLSRKFETK